VESEKWKVVSKKQQSVGELIDRIGERFDASGLFYGHGTDNAYDEAACLVLGVLDLPFAEFDRVSARRIDPGPARRILALADRRIRERIPVAYLINKAWFAGMQFYVDERVLIPRSPIAELIEERFSPWIGQAGAGRILDIGTGSGCIAVACAYAFPEAAVDAVDISPAALDVARRNVEAHGLSGRIHLAWSDLYDQLQGHRYDLIVANPPYVNTPEMVSLPAEYQHEPALALAAGSDGLDLIRRILAGSRQHLTDKGLLVVEAGNSQPAVESAFADLPLLWLDFERGGEGVFLLTAEDL